MTSFPNYPTAPGDNPDEAAHRRQITQVANLAIAGKANNKGDLTLTANAASTTITDNRLSYFSVIVFYPITANAAAEIAAGTMYVLEADHGNGTAVVTHANNAQTDRTFRYAILG